MTKALLAIAAALVLTACGSHDHEKVYAKDMTKTAEEAAIAAAPAAEPIKFEDDGAALFPGTVTATREAAPAPAATEATAETSTETATTETTESTETASTEPAAETATAESSAEGSTESSN